MNLRTLKKAKFKYSCQGEKLVIIKSDCPLTNENVKRIVELVDQHGYIDFYETARIICYEINEEINRVDIRRKRKKIFVHLMK